MIRRAYLLLPGAVLIAAASLPFFVPEWREAAAALVPLAGWVAIGTGILLGVRFGHVTVVVGLVVLALADRAVTRWGQAGDLREIVALLAPLNLAGLAWTSDRRARRYRVKLWTGLLALQALAVAGHVFLQPIRLPWPEIGPPSALAFAVALVVALARFAVHPRAVEAALVWAVVAAFLAFGAGGDPVVRGLHLAAGALALVVALVETSHTMAYGDELTGLPGRRALDELLSELGPRYAVAMVDVDHFKKFNDTYGHQAGDQLLRKLAVILQSVAGGGRAFRYGGEEFAVVFLGLDVEHASPHLDALRRAIAETTFTVRASDRPRRKPKQATPGSSGKQVGVTVSIGVADSTQPGGTPAEVVKAADEALYRAKRAGRNRLVW
ncbi:MAG: diguanylate cyclase [Candidatus Rokuibacteriota bacterium]